MNTILIRYMLAAVLGLITTARAPSADEPASRPATPPSDLCLARCQLQLTSLRDDVRLDRDTLQGIIESDNVLKQAAEKVFDLPPGRIHGSPLTVTLNVTDQQQTSEGQSMLISLSATLTLGVPAGLPDADAKATALLAEVCRRLEQVVAQRGQDTIARLRSEIERSHKQVMEAQHRLGQLQELQRKLYADAGQADLTRDRILGDLTELEKQRQSFDMRLAALHARQNALTEQIARIGKDLEAKAQQDPVAIELAKVVALRERALQAAQERSEAKLFSEQEVRDVEEKLALARADLAKQRQVANQLAGGNLLADFNKEVVNLAVEIAEVEAQREAVRERAAQIHERKLLELADRYDREVRPQLPLAEHAIEQALQRELQINTQLSAYRPPTLTVPGGSSPPANAPRTNKTP